MLVIKCAACKRKLWKYDKVGKGEVLRCHKERLMRIYDLRTVDNQVKCLCGKAVGIDKGTFIKMNGRAFTYSGTKRGG